MKKIEKNKNKYKYPLRLSINTYYHTKYKYHHKIQNYTIPKWVLYSTGLNAKFINLAFYLSMP